MGSQNLKFERGTKKEEQFLVVADRCRRPANFSLGRPNQMLTFEFLGGGGKQENPRKNISEQNREQTKSMASSPTSNPGCIDGGQIF